MICSSWARAISQISPGNQSPADILTGPSERLKDSLCGGRGGLVPPPARRRPCACRGRRLTELCGTPSLPPDASHAAPRPHPRQPSRHCPSSRDPERLEEAGRERSPLGSRQLRAMGTRLRRQIGGGPTVGPELQTAFPSLPKHTPHPPETLRPSREKVPVGTSFLSAIFLSPPPE